jgi:competence protein ComGC
MVNCQTSLTKPSENKGVTLIELLVVITIMMTMISLVAPLAINTVNKAEAQSEYLSFCGTLRKASIKAFVNGSGIHIELYENTLKAFKISPIINLAQHIKDSNKHLLFERSYQYLNFMETDIQFNKNGIANLTRVELKQGNKSRELDLIALLEK